MRVVVRNECVYCTALKSGFCSVFKGDDRDKCVKMVDDLDHGSDEFFRWVDTLPKDLMQKAFDELKKKLDELVNENISQAVKSQSA